MKIKRFIFSLFIFFLWATQVNAQYTSEQQQEIDSLTALLKVAKEDTTKIDLRFKIGETGWIFRTSYWDSISNDCIKLMAKPEISDKEKEVFKNNLAVTFNNTGFIYNNQGDVPQALKYFHRSLKLYEELQNEKGIASACNNIGLIYHEQGNIPMALKYYHKALKIREHIGNKKGIANSLNNIGFTYESQKNIPMALMYFNKSLDIYKELGDKKGIASSSNSIGFIYQNKGDIQKAREYHEQALEIQEEIGDKDGITYSMNKIGEIALLQGDVKLAKEYAEKSLEMSKELGFPSPISESSKILSDVAKKQHNYKEGWQHYETYIKMRDSVRNEETEKSVIEQEMKYEYEKMALKDSLKNAQLQEVKDLKIKEQNATIKEEQTKKYALVGGLILMLILVVLSIKGYQQKKKDNLLINQQKKQVEEKNKEITDSINYAKRIQEAILPPATELNKHLKNGFVLYKPKDIVAGDFYWMETISSLEGGLKVGDHPPSNSAQGENIVLFAAADCTGHGVPGAMVSVVCNGALNRSVREFKLTSPSEILNKVRELVIETFAKSKDDVKDGMDIALCSLQKEKDAWVIYYAGANNPLWIIRNGQLMETKPDKQPIGKYTGGKPFTEHRIEIQNEDTIYIFTDGFADQFGGPKGKKYKYESFRKFLLSIQSYDLDTQKTMLEKEFEEWKGDLEQVDDVCIIGVRI